MMTRFMPASLLLLFALSPAQGVILFEAIPAEESVAEGNDCPSALEPADLPPAQAPAREPEKDQ